MTIGDWSFQKGNQAKRESIRYVGKRAKKLKATRLSLKKGVNI